MDPCGQPQGIYFGGFSSRLGFPFSMYPGVVSEAGSHQQIAAVFLSEFHRAVEGRKVAIAVLERRKTEAIEFIHVGFFQKRQVVAALFVEESSCLFAILRKEQNVNASERFR